MVLNRRGIKVMQNIAIVSKRTYWYLICSMADGMFFDLRFSLKYFFQIITECGPKTRTITSNIWKLRVHCLSHHLLFYSAKKYRQGVAQTGNANQNLRENEFTEVA